MLADFPPTLSELDRLYKQLRAAYGQVAPLLGNVFQLKRSDQRFGRRTRLAAQIFARHVADTIESTIVEGDLHKMRSEDRWLNAARISFKAAEAFGAVEMDEYTIQIETELDDDKNDPSKVN